MKKSLGVLQVLLAGSCFGFLGIFGRLAYRSGIEVGELLFWRFLIASSLLGIGLLILRPRLLLLKAQQIFSSVLLGLFGYAVFSTMYFESIKGISVALAAMLLFTFPIFVSLGAHFILKERMNFAQWLSLAGTSFGLVILLWGDLEVHSLRSVILGLGAAITYSVYVLVSSRIQKNVPPLSSSLYVISASSLGLFIFHRPSLSHAVNFSSLQWSYLVGLAVICSILPLSLFLAGLQKMKSSQASILVTIEPVMASTAAWLLLGEALSLHQLVGGALILGSLVLNALSK